MAGSSLSAMRRVMNLHQPRSFFTRSLPGILFLLGILLLLPEAPIPLPGLRSLFELVVFLLILVFLGTLVGEAINPLSITIENITSSIVSIIVRLFYFGSIFLINFFPGLDESQVTSILYAIEKLFATKQELFFYTINSEFNPMENPDVFIIDLIDYSDPAIYDFVINSESLGLDMSEQNNILRSYSIANSILTMVEYGQARRFRPRYEFCRNVWVILGILFLLDISLFSLTGLETIVSNFLPRGIFRFLLLVGVIAFLSASRGYKKRFVENLFVDLYVISRLDDGNPWGAR